MPLIDTISESITQFIAGTGLLEWSGVFTGILCVWLAAKNNIWNWPIACISVIIYAVFFFQGKLYSDSGLQVYFLIMNIYGWYYWSKQKDKSTEERKISLIKKKEIIWSVIAIISFTLILGFTLFKKTDASFPFVDSFCTACSIVAQIFLARKVLENWLIWIFVDIIYVIMLFTKEFYATGLMYVLFIFIATMGYIDWRKIYRAQSH